MSETLSNDTAREICLFVQSFTGSRKDVSPNDSIWGDLGVDGDDAIELIAEFGKRFNVDMTGFKASDWFGPERAIGIGTLVGLAHFFWCGSWGQSARIKHMYVRDLINAAYRHRW
jgi:hypothetical protein